jgi:hypothetical protein
MSTTYKLDGTNVSTFGSVNLEGAQSVTLERTGDETLLSSQGRPFVEGAFYDNLSYTASVELSQPPKTVAVGDVGTLTLKCAARTNGEGVAAGVFTLTSAASAAVVSSVTHSVNHAGNSTSTINFRIVSIDGGVTDPLTIA